MRPPADLGPRCTWDADKRVYVYQLVEPVELAGEEVTEVRFRNVRPMDLDHIPAGESFTLGQIRQVLWSIASKHTQPAVLERLSMADYFDLTGIVGNLLAPAPQTGETGSGS